MTEKIATMYPCEKDTTRIETVFWNIEKNHQLSEFYITLALLGVSDKKQYDVEISVENVDTSSPKELHTYTLNSALFKGNNNRLADGTYTASVTAPLQIGLVEGTYRVKAILKCKDEVLDTNECNFYVKKVGDLA